MPLAFLCLASYFKGNRFLEHLKAEGCPVYLLTVESALGESWARHACDEVFAVKSFHDRRALVNAVAFLMRSRQIHRIVALDDFDIEVGAFLREHFRLTNTGAASRSAAVPRQTRDKARRSASASRTSASDNDQAVKEFWRVPPWLSRAEASAAGIRKLHSPDEVWKPFTNSATTARSTSSSRWCRRPVHAVSLSEWKVACGGERVLAASTWAAGVRDVGRSAA